VHYDRAACAAKGWTLLYADHVAREESVTGLLDELSRFLAFQPLAAELFASLVAPGRSDAAAAWYLALSRNFGENFGYYERTPALAPARRVASIVSLIDDVDRIIDAWAQIRDTVVARETSPTYWRDLAAFFGL
jgi:hypothetical protein